MFIVVHICDYYGPFPSAHKANLFLEKMGFVTLSEEEMMHRSLSGDFRSLELVASHAKVIKLTAPSEGVATAGR